MGLSSCGGSNEAVDLNSLPLNEQISLLDAKIRKEPNNAELFKLRAEALLKSEKTDEALSDIQKAIALNPKAAEYYVLQADILFVQGENALAFSALQNAIEKDGK